MKSQVRIELGLAMLMALLSACSPLAADAEVPPPTPAPTCTATVEADQEEDVLSDAETEAQDIATVDVIAQLAEAYARGEVNNVGELNAEDFTQLSSNVTEKLSTLQRGTAPNIYNNEAYLAPDTFKMRQVEDGTTAEQQTIEMFIPLSKDAEGNLMFTSPNGEWVTVEDSADFKDWNAVISSADDPRIELPIYIDSEGSDIFPEYVDRINPNTGKKYRNLVPLLVWNKSLGQIYLEGANGHGSRTNNILTFLKIETDEAGHPIYGRLVLGINIDSRIYTEGSDTFVGSAGMIREDFPFWNALQSDQLYYVMVDTDQQDTFDNGIFASLNNWTGFVPPKNSFEVLTGINTNNKDLLLIKFSNLIAKK